MADLAALDDNRHCIVYAAGAGGNRLVEVLYKNVIPFETKITVKQGDHEMRFASDEVEFNARMHNDYSRDWVERHKTYRKILRAASASSLLFLLSMLFYHISIWVSVRLKWLLPDAMPFGRYGARHYAAAAVSFAFFSYAFSHEDYHFKCDLFQHQNRFTTSDAGNAGAQGGQAAAGAAAAPTAPACSARREGQLQR